MSIHKDNATGKWRVVYRYTDWTGETHQSSKRGFPTKREAQMWERELLLKKEAKLDMTFESFYEIYVEDMQNRIRDNTWGTKTNIARTKILPYFGKRKIGEIEPRDIIAWQNELLAIRQPNGKPYSASYLQKIHSQLSAIFNHAVNFYHLPSNPAQKAGNMGKEEHREMLFWTKEEYLKFADAMMDKPVSYYAFEILYWCGLRMGELLALTPADFNFETHTLRINKSYQRLHREDVITPPKTLKSNRTIKMPQFLCDEMQDYLKMLYEPKEDERIFIISKSYLHHEMDRGAKASGVKRIRVHDLRHPYVKHTTKKYNSEKQKTQATKMDLIAWVFRFIPSIIQRGHGFCKQSQCGCRGIHTPFQSADRSAPRLAHPLPQSSEQSLAGCFGGPVLLASALPGR